MSLLLAAAVLPLVPITADDERLDKKRTFVSEEATAVLEEDADGRVLCLDRRRSASICLTEAQWLKAIELAEAQPKPAPRPIFPSRFDGIATGSAGMLYGRGR
jgi:hypothetical protein